MRLAIGSNAASVWWVNGQEVIGIYGDRQTVIDDGVSKRLTLKRGRTSCAPPSSMAAAPPISARAFWMPRTNR